MAEEHNGAPPDVYDEEFRTNLQISKNLISKLNRGGDKTICKKWIRKLIQIKSNDPQVKKNRNAFFKYLLEILNKAILETAGQSMGIGGAQGGGAAGGAGGASGAAGGGSAADDEHFMCKWSNDKRTYIAAKPLPGQGTLVYMAVTKDPALGWDHP